MSGKLGDNMRALVCLAAGLFSFAFSAHGDVFSDADPLPGFMNSARAIYAAPAAGDSAEDLAAFRWAMENYTEAVRQEDYQLAMQHGLKALELGERLDSVSSEFCANLALNLGRINLIHRREPHVFDMYDRSLGHFTDAFGESSSEHYLPLSEILSYSIRRYKRNEAKRYDDELGKVVSQNFDFPSLERGYYFIRKSQRHRLEVMNGSSVSSNIRKIKGFLLRALEDFEAIGDDHGIGDARFELGRYHIEFGRYRSARRELGLALEAFERAGLQPGEERILRCHLFMAEAWIRDGRDDEATPHLQFVSQHQGEVDQTDIKPLIRVAPTYPIRAARQRIEGWVLMEFTITTEGKVRDPVVIDHEPSSIFDAAATEAVFQWRYVPLSRDGEFF